MNKQIEILEKIPAEEEEGKQQQDNKIKAPIKSGKVTNSHTKPQSDDNEDNKGVIGQSRQQHQQQQQRSNGLSLNDLNDSSVEETNDDSDPKNNVNKI